ncbi:hypothetical protein JXA56_04335 [Candidatus Micrarchaeota archaeon]|nr:hypothetical protein [Candidatus Micrarchaeota archaeon]
MKSPLPYKYYACSVAVPPVMRVRRPLEEEIYNRMSDGENILLRGIPKIGKSITTSAVISKAERETVLAGVPMIKTGEEVKGLFESMKSDEKMFILIEDFNRLSVLEPVEIRKILEKLNNPPKNVTVIISSLTNHILDGMMEKELGNYTIIDIRSISDIETDYLVREPARGYGIAYKTDAVEAIAKFSGRRPLEVFIMCYLTTSILDQHDLLRYGAPIGKEQVEHAMDLPILQMNSAGMSMISHYKRVFENCLDNDERMSLEMINAGFDIEDKKKLGRLEALGLVTGQRINGELLRDLIDSGFLGN